VWFLENQSKNYRRPFFPPFFAFAFFFAMLLTPFLNIRLCHAGHAVLDISANLLIQNYSISIS
jgi:hypothetical protein